MSYSNASQTYNTYLCYYLPRVAVQLRYIFHTIFVLKRHSGIIPRVQVNAQFSELTMSYAIKSLEI